jgi:hypothetical protein
MPGRIESLCKAFGSRERDRRLAFATRWRHGFFGHFDEPFQKVLVSLAKQKAQRGWVDGSGGRFLAVLHRRVSHKCREKIDSTPVGDGGVFGGLSEDAASFIACEVQVLSTTKLDGGRERRDSNGGGIGHLFARSRTSQAQHGPRRRPIHIPASTGPESSLDFDLTVGGFQTPQQAEQRQES